MAWCEEIGGAALRSYGKFCFQRMVFSKLADTEHTEPQHLSLFINGFHNGIVRR